MERGARGCPVDVQTQSYFNQRFNGVCQLTFVLTVHTFEGDSRNISISVRTYINRI